jgi:L-asparaginase
LAPWARLTADPETAHGTVTLMVRDRHGDIASGVSTSGWAWKYPGRVGDSPIVGAGNYADNRHGAASCTGFGEMTIRASSARSVILYLKQRLALPTAVRAAVDDLHALTWRYRGRVTLYAFDRAEGHCVTTYAHGTTGGSAYQIWETGMSGPERREGTVITDGDMR